MSSRANVLPMPPYPWQQNNWNEFIQRVIADRVPNATLIHGSSGVGIELLAQAMGQFLLCLSPLESIACGKCKGCHLSAAGTHPDYQRVTIEEKAKQLKIDQIREISDFVARTSQMNGYKVVIMESADSMNVNAANALLKNLEEPAGKTAFFLTSENVNQLLPTIRSRCFQQLISLPSVEESMSWFNSQNSKISESMLLQAGKATLLAQDWLDKDIFVERKKIIDGLIRIALKQQTAMSVAQQWIRSEIELILDTMQHVIEQVIQGLLAQKVLDDDVRRVQDFLSSMDTPMLFRYKDTLSSKKSLLLQSNNLNAALMIEELWLDWGALCDFNSRKKQKIPS